MKPFMGALRQIPFYSMIRQLRCELIPHPGTINSDAVLGYGVYTYQSADVLFGAVGTRGDLLVRLDGLRGKGHSD